VLIATLSHKLLP